MLERNIRRYIGLSIADMADSGVEKVDNTTKRLGLIETTLEVDELERVPDGGRATLPLPALDRSFRGAASIHLV